MGLRSKVLIHLGVRTVRELKKRTKTFFFFFFSDLSSVSNYTISIIQNSIWFKQIKTTLFFLLFFSDLSSTSDYVVTVIPHSKYFEQTKKRQFFYFFFQHQSDLCLQLRSYRNHTQQMIWVNEKKLCFVIFFWMWIVSSNHIVCIISVIETDKKVTATHMWMQRRMWKKRWRRRRVKQFLFRDQRSKYSVFFSLGEDFFLYFTSEIWGSFFCVKIWWKKPFFFFFFAFFRPKMFFSKFSSPI